MNSSGDPTDLAITATDDDERDRNTIFGWIYLGLIMAVFIAIALWAYQRTGSSTTTVVLGDPPTTTAAPAAVLEPAVVDVSIDRKIATLTGYVPDEGARGQLVRIAEDRFGNGNVIDELTVDSGVDLATGTINFTGIADEGDTAPSELLQNAAADLGLGEGVFDIQFVAPQFDPAVVDVALGDLPVLITGRVPQESDRERLLQSAEAVYGEGNVDVSGVVVEPSDLEGAEFTLSGLTEPGDARAIDLVGILETDFGSAVVIDSTEIDLSAAALEALEARLEAALVEKPILFDLGTSTISEEGQANLLVVAEAILAVPDRAVQIIGHTDDTGGDTLNQLLSERRAESVKEALVGLGVEESRLTTEGRGSAEPAVPNTSPDNRARNRRIEFTFEK